MSSRYRHLHLIFSEYEMKILHEMRFIFRKTVMHVSILKEVKISNIVQLQINFKMLKT